MSHNVNNRMLPALLCGALLSTLVAYSPNVTASEEAECGIWLCLPTGFGEGCGDAKKAFKKRIKKLKSPLPPFLGCMLGGDNEPATSTQFTAIEGFAAYLPVRQVCVKTQWSGYGRDKYKVCVEHETRPSEIIQNTRCRINNGGKNKPAGCTKTMRFVQTLMQGAPYGEPYYY